MYPLSAAILIIGFGLAYFGVEYFRRFSIARRWLDFPNERSSHITPTPRGAGIVIVIVCLVGYVLFSVFGQLTFSWGYFLGALLIAGVSWVDDLHSLSFITRLTIQFVAAILLLLNGNLDTKDLIEPFSFIGSLFLVIWIVWMVNAYNFMDGIDGIAGLQGIVAAGSWAFLTFNSEVGLYYYTLILFAAVSAFLVHNWSPARVFMGDVGSAFLGFTFAAFPFMVSTHVRFSALWLPVVAALILWPFVFDTVLTLLRRIIKRDRFWKAHREHLYQKMVKKGYSHSSVSFLYGAFALATSASAIGLLSGFTSFLPLVIVLVAVSFAFAIFVFRISHSVQSS
jgi:UDP-N-acetylmuramyl pentapeptide phosphotransferase/UDP-N-acetylglucosamine-1-phosphate transferase